MRGSLSSMSVTTKRKSLVEVAALDAERELVTVGIANVQPEQHVARTRRVVLGKEVVGITSN